MSTMIAWPANERREAEQRAKPGGTDSVHPRIYKAMIGLAALFVLAALMIGGGVGETDAFAMVAVLFVVAIGIPAIITLIARASREGRERFEHGAAGSFREWRESDFSVCGSRVKGTDAAIEMLAPIAAVAVGLAAFAIVAAIVLP